MARRAASAASQLGPVLDGKRARRQDPGAAAGLANSLSQAERARRSVSGGRSRSRSADQDEEATQRVQGQSSALASRCAHIFQVMAGEVSQNLQNLKRRGTTEQGKARLRKRNARSRGAFGRVFILACPVT